MPGMLGRGVDQIKLRRVNPVRFRMKFPFHLELASLYISRGSVKNEKPLAAATRGARGLRVLMGFGLLAVQRVLALTSASNLGFSSLKRSSHTTGASERLSLSTLAKFTVR